MRCIVNKKSIVSVFAALCIMMCSVAAYASDAPSAVKRLTKSVVEVTVNNSFGTETVTGVVTGKNSDYVITSFNAMDGGTDIKVTYNDETTSAEVCASDKSKNMAVLHISQENGIKGVKPVRLYMKDKEKNTDIYIVGHKSEADSINSGIILDKGTLSVFGSEAVDIYTVNAEITREDNGAVLADKSGNLAGICLYDGNTNANKAVTALEISELLDANSIPYKKATILFIVLAVILVLAAAAAAAFAVSTWIKKRRELQPVLEGTKGEFAGQSVALSEENISIGRDPKYCQIVILRGDKVSHCYCSVRDDKNKGMFMLTDLSSTHGTYLLSGEKLEPNVPKYLNEGAMFKIGDDNNIFRVKIGDDTN